MGYKIFDTEVEAMSYSHTEAIAHGHGREGNIIQYWWEYRQCADGKWAVQCQEGTEAEPEWKPVEEE